MTSAEGASFLRGSGGMHPREIFLNIVSLKYSFLPFDCSFQQFLSEVFGFFLSSANEILGIIGHLQTLY